MHNEPVTEEEKVPPKDYFKRTIQVGDHLAYAVRDGNVAVMKDGVVTGFKWKRNPYDGRVESAIVMRTKCSRWSSKPGEERTTHLWINERAVIMRSLCQGGKE